MSSLSSEMAKQEIMNPNSLYFAGGPSVMDEINGYMKGIPYGSSYSALTKRNMYIGQPVMDKFESLANARVSRQTENIFKTIVGGTAALFAALALRKIPGVSTIVKGTFSGIGNIFKYTGIGIGKSIAWLFKK